MFYSILEYITVILGVSAGLASILTTVLRIIDEAISKKNKIRVIQEIKLEKILGSDDIVIVGSYLDDVVGKFNIEEYVSDNSVATLVNKYLNRIQKFVGTDEDINKQRKEISPPEAMKKPLDVTGTFKKVYKYLEEGDMWAALSYLRRTIETELRTFTREAELELKRPLSAGALINYLYQRDYLSHEAYENFRYAVTICNGAVHGLDVNLREAEKAITSAAIAFNELRKVN
jgi:hypothetical protein